MENKIFKIGIMGGDRGRYAIMCEEFLSDQMEVVALCETNDALLATLEKDGLLTDKIKVYKDFDVFIHSGLDAVLLCNYFPEHAKYAIKAMESGVAVLSETTAAPSLGECVQLVEAAERTGVKYMLGANCIYYRTIQAMKQRMEEKKFGDPVFIDCEYIHSVGKGGTTGIAGTTEKIDTENLHWRKTLPRCYYNMHDFGPMMYAINAYPKRVMGKAVTIQEDPLCLINAAKCYALVEMDNGAVINYSGATRVGTTGKWYRIACTEGTVETPRYAEGGDKLIEGELHTHKTVDITWTNSGALTEEEAERFGSGSDDFMKKTHGGVDLILLLNFLKYLRDETKPFFDVYNAVALSATSIMSWYSMLLDGKQLDIPDFRTQADRDKYRNDFRNPFAKRLADITLPFRVGEKFEL